MDGFKRPEKRFQPPQPPRVQVAPPTRPIVKPTGAVVPKVPPAPDVESTPPQVPPQSPKTSLSVAKRRRWPLVVCGIFGVILLLAIGVVLWYLHALTPMNPEDHTMQQVQVGESASFRYVSGRLEERQLIRSSLALQLYAYIHNQAHDLKQGTCNLSPSESAPDILHKLTAGCHDFDVVTFYPGATIEKPKSATASNAKDFSVRGSLEKAGFKDSDITAAFNATYDSPLFADKPAGASLEGYIYGDTYYINTDAGPEQALKDAFSEMEKVVESNDLVAKFKAHGLTLYQGITLASIIQRELSCDNLEATQQATCYSNQQKVAQVFYSRLASDMTLGSDVTFIYAAGLTGEAASPTIDSPYNTRLNKGLPPGPIATPSEFALKAAANPASTDYLYFIAGDEGGGAMYFAKTQAEHEQNIKDHCQVLCSAG